MPTQLQDPQELIGGAVRVVFGRQRRTPCRHGVVPQVGSMPESPREPLRHWTAAAGVDAGSAALNTFYARGTGV
jgi:hypothetical protein